MKWTGVPEASSMSNIELMLVGRDNPWVVIIKGMRYKNGLHGS
jgi:hypothetical protein